MLSAASSDSSIIYPAYALAAAILLVAGMLDDIYELGVAIRFCVQGVAAAIMALWGGVMLTDLGHLVSAELVVLGMFALPMTVFATCGGINALNMVDGVDGLAGSLSFITLIFLAIVAGLADRIDYLVFTGSVMAATAGFLLYNLRLNGKRRASVFMGDAGSYVLGFTIVWLCIALAQGPDRAMTPVTALWLFAVPLMDTIVVMIRRKWSGGSPFVPDHTHLHHLLLQGGFRAPQVVRILAGLQIVLGTIGLVGLYQNVSEWIMFYILLGVLILYLYLTRRPTHIIEKLRQWHLKRAKETELV